MADYKGLNITWRADASPATRALNQLSAEMKAAQANITATQRALDSTSDASKDLAMQLRSIQLQEMGKAAQAAGEKVKAYSQLLTELNEALQRNREKYVANQEALESYDPYEKLADSATESMKRVTEAQQALAEATQRVEFSGNTQDWVQALNDQAEAQRNLNAVMAEGDAAFERAGEESERYVNSLKGSMNAARENIVHLGEEITTTTQKMKVQEAQAESLGNQYASMQADMDALVAKEIAADSALGEFGSKMQDMGERVTSVGGSIKDLGDKMNYLGDKMSLVKGFALTQFVRTMVTDTEDFGNSIAQLGGYLGISGDALDKMSDQALQWGKDTQFSAGEAAQAMNELAKGGMTEAQISGGAMDATMQLAAAGELDMASAAETAARAIKVFGLESDDAASVADALAGAATKSTAEVSDLAAGFAQIGGAAQMAGWDINEVTGGLALLADRGFSGSEAGTTLKTTLQRLASPTKKAAETMADLGIEVYGADGKMKDALDVIGQFEDALDGLTDQQRNKALLDIFGARGVNGITALLSAGTEGFREYVAATEQAGYASEMAESRMGDLGWALEYLRGEAETAIVTLGEAYAPMIKDVAGAIESALGWFNSMTDGQQEFVAKSALVVAAFGPMVSGFGSIVSAAGSFVTSIGTGVETLSTFSTLMGMTDDVADVSAATWHNLAEAYALATGHTEDLTAATDGILTSLKGLQAGIATVGIVALIADLGTQLYDYVEHEREFEKATDGLRDTVNHLNESFASNVSALNNASRNYIEVKDAANSLNKAQAEISSSLTNSADEVSKNSTMLDQYAETIKELGDKGRLTAGEEEKLSAAVEGFNNITGASVDIIDIHTGRLDANEEAIDRVVSAWKRYADVQATMDAYQKVNEQLIENQIELERLEEELQNAAEGFGIWIGDFQVIGDLDHLFDSLHGSVDGTNVRFHELQKSYEQAKQRAEELEYAAGRLSERMDDASMSGSDYKDMLKDLGLASNDASEDVESLEGDVEDLAETTSEATEEMKRAIADAVEARKRALDDAYTLRKRELDEDMSNLKAANKQAEEEEKAHWDEQKRILKEGLDADSEQLEESLKEDYDLRKDELKKQRDLLKESLDDELSTLKDGLNAAYEARKDELDREYSQLKDQLSKQLSAEKSELSEEVSNLKAAQKERVNQVKDAMAEEVSARKDALKKQVDDQKAAFSEMEKTLKEEASLRVKLQKEADSREIASMKAEHTAAETALKKTLDAQYKERQKAAQREYKSWQKQNQKLLKEYKAQQQAEVKAFKSATSERIAAIKEEYEARKRYVADHDGTKEIDEQIAALNAEAKAEEEAKRQQERAEKTAELRLAVERAKTRRTRQDAEQALSDYLNQLAEEDRKAERQRLIDSLEERKDAISEETKAIQSGLDEQRDAEIEAYQDRRDLELEQLQARHSEQYELMSEQLAEELELRKEAQDAQLSAYKETLDLELETLKTSNQAKRDERAAEQEAAIEQMEADNAARLEQMTKDHAAELAEIEARNSAEITSMQKHNEAVIKRMEDDNANVIKRMEADNQAYLEQMEEGNKARLQAVHDQNEAELEDIKARNEAEVKDKEASNAAILADQETHDENQLKELQKANAAQLKEVTDRNAQEVRDFEDSTEKIVKSLQKRNSDAETELKYYNDNILTELKRKNDDALTQFKRDLDDGKLTVDKRTGEVKKAVDEAKKSVTKDVGDTGEKAKTTAGQASQYVTDKVLKAKEEVLGSSGKVKSGMKSDNEAIEKSSKDAWSNISTAAHNGADKVYSDVTDKIGKLPEWMNTTGSKIPQNLANSMNGNTSHLNQSVDAIVGKIEEIDKSGESGTWGEDTGRNFASGLNIAYNDAYNAVMGYVDLIKDYLGHSIPKAGPLREGGRGEVVWGEDLVRNLNQGLMNEMPNFEATITRMADLASQAFDRDALIESSDTYLMTYRDTLRRIEEEAKRHAALMESYGFSQTGGSVPTIDMGSVESFNASMEKVTAITKRTMDETLTVIQRSVNEALRGGMPSSGVTVNVGSLTVREVADVDRVADSLYNKIHTHESMSLRR